MNEGIEIKNPEQENPLAVIEELKQQASARGTNDGEFSHFHEITEELRSGKSSPEEAIRKAREVVSGKQDYH